MTEFYSTGTIAVTNGSVDFVGTGTAWLPVNAKKGDTLNVAGYVILIDEPTDPTHGKFAIPYPGATGSGLPYAIVKTSAEWGTNRTLAVQTAEMIQLLTTVSVDSTGISINAWGTFANRTAHDSAAAGFRYLALDGDGVTGVWTIYMKLSAAAGDWDTGQQMSGAEGKKGDTGDDGWSPVFALTTDGDRRVLELVDWTGGEGAKPATGLYVGASGLTPTIGDAVDVRGSAGSGSGDVNTSGSVNAQRLARYADGTGDLIEDAGKTVDDVLDRANHTGLQAITTVTGLQSALDGAIQSTLLTTRGDILVRGAAVAARLAKGTQYQVLQAGATDLIYGAVNLAQAAAVTGILPAANLPDATQSAKGVSQFATAALYRAGTDTARSLVVDQVWAAAALTVLADAATITVDLSAGFNFGGAGNAPLALGGNRDLGAPSNVYKNQAGVLWFGASGATRTLTLNAAWKLATGVEAGPYSITTSQELGVAYVVRGSDVIVTAIVRRG